jgi:thioredoxin reductase (NADPH)
MSAYLRDEIAAAAGIDVRYHTEVTGGGGDGRLAWLSLQDIAAGTTAKVDAGALFILIGVRPRTGWLPSGIERDSWGFMMTGPDITMPPARLAEMFETSLPGVFAVGDARHGSVKRVAAAVGEGSVVIQQVQRYLTETKLRAGSAR